MRHLVATILVTFLSPEYPFF